MSLYLFRGDVKASLVFLLLPAVIAGALSSTIFILPSAVSRMYPILLAAVSFGLFSGWSVQIYSKMTAPYTGIPLEEVTAFTGCLLEDGYETAGGQVRYRLRLNTVKDRNGRSADAAGEVTLDCEDAHVRSWGAELSVMSGLSLPEGETGERFWSRAVDGQLSQEGWSSPFFEYRQRVRSFLIYRIRSTGSSGSALLEALLLGVRDDLNLFETELFRRSGCMHILALSGMHLGILTGLLYLLLGLFLNKRVSYSLTVVIVVFYVLIAGYKPSLIRAAVMVGLVWIGMITGRKSNGFTLLLTTFIILSIAFPDSWKTLSFQLSFCALGGIILFGNSIARLFAPYLPRWISLPIAASLGAQMTTGGILIFWFKVLYPIGICAVLVLTPLVTVFIWVGIVYLMCANIPVVGFYLSRITDSVYHVIIQSASLFAQVPGIEFTGLKGTFLFCCAMLVLLIFIYMPRERPCWSILIQYRR